MQNNHRWLYRRLHRWYPPATPTNFIANLTLTLTHDVTLILILMLSLNLIPKLATSGSGGLYISLVSQWQVSN